MIVKPPPPTWAGLRQDSRPVKTKASARDPSLFRAQTHSACGLDSAR